MSLEFIACKEDKTPPQLLASAGPQQSQSTINLLIYKYIISYSFSIHYMTLPIFSCEASL